MGTTITKQSVIVEYISKSTKFKQDQKQIAKSTVGLGKLFNNLGKQIAGLATAAAVFAVLRDAAKTIGQFEVSIKQLSSLTGLTGKVLDELGAKAIEMSADFGTSARDIVDGFGKVGSAAPQLLDNAEALAEVTHQADILSAAAGISLDEAIDGVTKTMNQYGLEAHQAAEITDILATSQQKGTARITDLTLALKNVGSVAAAQGISFANTNVHLQALAKGGLLGAEAGTKLRSVYLKLAKTGRDDLNPATQDFNDILKILGKEVKTVNQAQKIFGEEGAAAALTLIKQADTVAKLTDKLHEQGNAMSQAAINTDTSANAIKRAGAAWEALVLSIDTGQGIISKTFKSLVEGATSTAKALAFINSETFRFSKNLKEALTDTGQIAAELRKADALFGEFLGDEEGIEGLKLHINLLAIQIEQQEKWIELNARGDEALAESQDIVNEKLALKVQLQKQLFFLTQETNKEEESGGEDTDEAITLNVLKERLKAAQTARGKLTEGDTAGLKANERLIIGLRKRIKAMSIAKKETEDFAKTQKEAARAIEALKVALIEDDTERAIAALRLQSKQQIEDAKGTERQIAEFRLLTEIKTSNDILKIRQKMLDDFEQMARESIAESDEEREEALLAADIRATEAEDLIRQRQILAVKERQLAGNINAQEAADEITQIELLGLKDRIDDLQDSTPEKIALFQAIADAEIAIEEEKNSRLKDLEDDLRQQRQDAVIQSVQLITTILDEVFRAEQERIENSIKLQEERVAKALDVASGGNAEILQLEEERLLKLQQARDAAARKQRAIQAIQIAANAALAISNTIVSITSDGAKGGAIAAIAGGIALAATVAAAVIAMRNALSNVPVFAEGVDQLKGTGTATSDSIPVRLSKGERVVPSASNDKLVKMGITNDNIVAVAAAGMAAIQSPVLSSAAFGSNPNAQAGSDLKGLRKDIKANTKAIENIGVSANIDADGFTATIAKRNKFEERRKKLLN